MQFTKAAPERSGARAAQHALETDALTMLVLITSLSIQCYGAFQKTLIRAYAEVGTTLNVSNRCRVASYAPAV